MSIPQIYACLPLKIVAMPFYCQKPVRQSLKKHSNGRTQACTLIDLQFTVSVRLVYCKRPCL